MSTVKIIVATHKKFIMPTDNELYIPVHVGCEGKNTLGYLGDNTGVNISLLNPYYCELTGLYWAWKNLKCDYLGLVHYRRYFTIKKFSYSDRFNIDDIILSQSDIQNLLNQSDVIVPKKRRYFIETLYSHYAHTLNNVHLDITRRIISQHSPDYLTSFDKVMKYRSGYMFNMFIMKRSLLDDYMSWLFVILNNLFEEVDHSQMSHFEARYIGRVSEILFNVWLEKNGILPKEIPFIYLEKVSRYKKIKSFLEAKFLGRKYGTSF